MTISGYSSVHDNQKHEEVIAYPEEENILSSPWALKWLAFDLFTSEKHLITRKQVESFLAIL